MKTITVEICREHRESFAHKYFTIALTTFEPSGNVIREKVDKWLVKEFPDTGTFSYTIENLYIYDPLI